jgi:hypothetical protein
MLNLNIMQIAKSRSTRSENMKVLRAQKSADRAAKLATRQAQGGEGREDSSSGDSDVSGDSDYGEDEFTAEDEENHRRLEASFREEALEDEGTFVRTAMMNFPPLEYASTGEIPQEVGQSERTSIDHLKV